MCYKLIDKIPIEINLYLNHHSALCKDCTELTQKLIKSDLILPISHANYSTYCKRYYSVPLYLRIYI